MKDVELTIIGGGPVGLFAAYYARLRNVHVRVIESLPTVGGQITALYPQKQILDVAGFVDVTGAELVSQLKTQAKQLNPEIVTNTIVNDVIAINNGFNVVTSAGDFHSDAVILATGRGNFTPRKLPFDDLPMTVTKHLHYVIGDGTDFTGKRVLVAGGGDTAVEAALALTKHATTVHLMHRRATFRALEHTVMQLQASDVQLEVPYLISGVAANADGSLTVKMQEVLGDDVKVVNVDEVVVSYGFLTDNLMMDNWQVQAKQVRGSFVVDQRLATDVPGLFVIGDAATYPGRTELLSTGFGEAPLAVNAAVQFIDPSRRGPIHSSSLKIEDGHVQKQ